jgi:hypothetical protein
MSYPHNMCQKRFACGEYAYDRISITDVRRWAPVNVESTQKLTNLFHKEPAYRVTQLADVEEVSVAPGRFRNNGAGHLLGCMAQEILRRVTQAEPASVFAICF